LSILIFNFFHLLADAMQLLLQLIFLQNALFMSYLIWFLLWSVLSLVLELSVVFVIEPFVISLC